MPWFLLCLVFCRRRSIVSSQYHCATESTTQDMTAGAVEQCFGLVGFNWDAACSGTMNQQVDDIFNKVGYDPAANAQAKRKAPSDGQGQGAGEAGSGGLPRMDLSTLLEKVHSKYDNPMTRRRRATWDRARCTRCNDVSGAIGNGDT